MPAKGPEIDDPVLAAAIQRITDNKPEFQRLEYVFVYVQRNPPHAEPLSPVLPTQATVVCASFACGDASRPVITQRRSALKRAAAGCGELRGVPGMP